MTHNMQQQKDLTLKTTTCHYSLMFAIVSHQPEASGSPQCKHGVQVTGPGLLEIMHKMEVITPSPDQVYRLKRLL